MQPNYAAVVRALAEQKAGYGLTQPFYSDPSFFEVELETIFHKEWLFAGHECELKRAGDWITLQVGAYPILIVRGQEGQIRAFHNVCRHRGFKLCDAAKGQAPRRIVCPYHQWAYDLDGRLARTRGMRPDFDGEPVGLKPVHCESVGGYVFVSLAKEAPDFAPFRALFQDYVAPFDLANAKVAFESRIIEKGNWKIVFENNRECYHCRGSHPELCRTFPESPTHTGRLDTKEGKIIDALVKQCEAMGLPGRYRVAESGQYRVMRLPLESDARSMTMTGQPAVARRLGRCPADDNIGDVLCFHYPSTWNHWTADHALSFRVLPLSATETELVTRWLVPGDAVEGKDYDLKTLTEVWLATNEQDQHLVERTQAGNSSPAFEPGPYSTIHEDGVIQFIEWYRRTMTDHLAGPALRIAAE